MKPYKRPIPIYPHTEWSIKEEQYSEEHNMRNESIFAIGNGYIGMRGNFEEGYRGTKGRSANGTFLNGFYDSEPIEYPEGAYGYATHGQTMLNVSDAKIVYLEIDGERFDLHEGAIHRYERELDMAKGLLVRQVEWESPSGRKVRIRITRMISLRRKHVAVVHYEATPLNFDGQLTFRSEINGQVTNQAAGDDPRVGAAAKEPMLLLEGAEHEDGLDVMRHRTRHTRFALVTAAAHEIKGTATERQESNGSIIASVYEAKAANSETVALTKYIAFATSKDYAEADLLGVVREELSQARAAGFEGLAAEQAEYLTGFWKRTDVQIYGDPALQQGVRFNAYQLLQSTGKDGVTNIGAKGLTGEGYEGHYFWDTEMYILPFFTYTNPEIGKKLLEFRHHTLDKARERARIMSQKGALFPWRTINGEEASAYFPAGTAQVHINADIAYGIKKYVTASGDVDFLLRYGAEILFETSRFWVDLGFFNEAKGGRFCIDAVTGPDEYTAIVNNNAFTNLMVQDQLSYAAKTARWMQAEHGEAFRELAAKIGLASEEIEGWTKAAESMYVPYSKELGITGQDDTFLSKQKWDFEGTPEDKYPLLLHFHPLVIYRHQVLKQPDLVLAMYLLGDRFSMAEKLRNYDYYEPLTTHDSSLSPCIHGIVAAELRRMDEAYDYFDRTVRMDLDDINKNVKDGLHTAAMAGSWLCIVNGFGGMRNEDGVLRFDPVLPEQWDGFRFRVNAHGRLIDVYADRGKAEYTLLEGERIEIRHRSQTLELQPGKPAVVSLAPRLEAVIFDLDGVITDSAEYHYLAWKQLADELGAPFDRKVNERLKGVSRMESLEIILEQGGLKLASDEKAQLAARKNDVYKQMIERITPADVLPGIPELLKELQAEGIRIGLASASQNAPFILDKLQLADVFEAVADPQAAAKGKPDPELFLMAAESLGINPAHCIGVEDSAAGIVSIKAANMKAVGVGDAAILQGADTVVPETSGLNLAALKQLFA